MSHKLTDKLSDKIRIGMVSLGCPKNQCDAELMLAKIARAGYKIVPEAGLADVVIINTCGFIQSAKEEAIEEIMEAINRKNDGINKKIIVTGCLAQRYQEQMDTEFPEIDGVLGIGRNDAIIETIERVLAGERVIDFGSNSDLNMEGRRLQSTLPHYAYLRIADGCDNCCTFCAIPLIRGRFRSRRMEDIVKEAGDLVSGGVKELVVIAQDTTRYGEDIYGKLALPELLRKLAKLDVKWIRLMYCYPEEIDDDLIEAMSTCEKVCRYIDMPIQHICDNVLKRMGRKTCSQDIKNKINKLRERIPGIVIRTSLITGFPAETEEEHKELLGFIKEYGLEKVGVFTYSKEEGTPAAKLKPQVLKRIKERRKKELMLEQQKVVFAQNKALKGKVMRAVVEGFLPEENVYVARTYRDAPDIDGCVFVESGKELVLGTMIDVRIKKASGYDLIAAISR